MKWELKKIITKKLTIVIFLLMAAYLVFININEITQFKYYDTKGREYKGLNVISIMKEQDNLLSGIVSDKKIKSDLKTFISVYDYSKNLDGRSIEKGMSNDDYYGFYKPRSSLFYWVMENYTSGKNIPVLERLTMSDIDNMEEFYKQRGVLVEETIENYGKFKLSSNEKEYWRNQAIISAGPYEYGYTLPVNMILNNLMHYSVIIMGIGICLAGVFSDEYESDTEQILLTAKYGRSRLPYIKTAAAFLFSMISLTVLLLLGLGLYLYMGKDGGWNLSIQLLKTNIVLAWTFKELIIRILCLIYLIMAVLTGLILFVSSRTRRTVIPMIVAVLLVQGGLFLNMIGGEGLNRIKWMFPDRLLLPNYYHLISYELFGHVFNIYTFAVFLYGFLIIAITPFSMNGFKYYTLDHRRKRSG